MIGAMPAVACGARDRRKNKTGGGVFAVEIDKDGELRPTQLMIKPHISKKPSDETDATHPSRAGSRAGTPTSADGGPGAASNHHDHADDADEDELKHKTVYVRYGDECCNNRVSLLHFIIFFLLGGITVVIVGAVQFKKEAGLSELRYHFLVLGSLLVTAGLVLLVVKCVWFRVAVHVPVPVLLSPTHAQPPTDTKETLPLSPSSIQYADADADDETTDAARRKSVAESVTHSTSNAVRPPPPPPSKA